MNKLRELLNMRWLARSTVFAAFFSITSFLLARGGHLTAVYVSMCTAVQLMVVGRAVAEDYHERSLAAKNGGSNDPGTQ